MTKHPPLTAGMPVIAHATLHVHLVTDVDESLTGRLRIDLEEGSKGLTENEIDRIVSTRIDLNFVTDSTTGKLIKTKKSRMVVISDVNEEIEVDRRHFDAATSYVARLHHG